jgi:hypothetical protein
MPLHDILRSLLPSVKVDLWYDAFKEASVIFLKLRLWSDLSLMATVTVDRSLRPQLKVQFITKLSEGFTLTSRSNHIIVI